MGALSYLKENTSHPVFSTLTSHSAFSFVQHVPRNNNETTLSFLLVALVCVFLSPDQNYVLSHYKTELCKKPPRLCRQGYACPYYHNSKDRRRSPHKHKYRCSIAACKRKQYPWILFNNLIIDENCCMFWGFFAATEHCHVQL